MPEFCFSVHNFIRSIINFCFCFHQNLKLQQRSYSSSLSDEIVFRTVKVRKTMLPYITKLSNYKLLPEMPNTRVTRVRFQNKRQDWLNLNHVGLAKPRAKSKCVQWLGEFVDDLRAFKRKMVYWKWSNGYPSDTLLRVAIF